MNRQVLINNLKFIKRTFKEFPEHLRIIRGYVERNYQRVEGLDYTREPISLRAYRPGHTEFPMTVATPADGHFMTTFFDVNPFSPSGRYLAITQVPFIHRIPLPGDKARICVVDLESGECAPVYETVGWGAQLGANVQWGMTDNDLFCNNVVEGRATGVHIRRSDGHISVLGGGIYGLSPDKKFSYCANLELINAIIPGYGVPDPLFGKVRQRECTSATEGIWKTDLLTGESRLFKSVIDILKDLPGQEELKGGKYYVFNIKVNPQNTRIFAILFSRGVPYRAGAPVQLVTMDIDGSNVRLAMPDRLWRVGGHHPNWTPDGDHIVMNLRHNGGTMAFVKFKYDGSDLHVIAPGHKGSGHPSLHPTGRYLLTDSYVSEGFRTNNGEIPLRLIDLEKNDESHVCLVDTKNLAGPRRIDPHPVWSPSGDRFAFNGVIGDRRQVIVADTSVL